MADWIWADVTGVSDCCLPPWGCERGSTVSHTDRERAHTDTLTLALGDWPKPGEVNPCDP